MKSAIEISSAYAGIKFLQEEKILNAKIEPSGRFEINSIKNSPRILPAICVSFRDDIFAPAINIEIHLEITDLRWSPFYFMNKILDYEGNICRLNESGKAIEVYHDLKRTFIEVGESRDYGIENILQNRRRNV